MRRPARIAAIAVAVVAFGLLSAGLARTLSANGAERAAIEDSIEGQLGRDVEIVRLDLSTSFSPLGSEGVARVVWRAAGRELPVVQCAGVLRDGDAAGGLTVRVVRLGAPIGLESSCPGELSDI